MSRGMYIADVGREEVRGGGSIREKPMPADVGLFSLVLTTLLVLTNDNGVAVLPCTLRDCAGILDGCVDVQVSDSSLSRSPSLLGDMSEVCNAVMLLGRPVGFVDSLFDSLGVPSIEVKAVEY